MKPCIDFLPRHDAVVPAARQQSGTSVVLSAAATPATHRHLQGKAQLGCQRTEQQGLLGGTIPHTIHHRQPPSRRHWLISARPARRRPGPPPRPDMAAATIAGGALPCASASVLAPCRLQALRPCRCTLVSNSGITAGMAGHAPGHHSQNQQQQHRRLNMLQLGSAAGSAAVERWSCAAMRDSLRPEAAGEASAAGPAVPPLAEAVAFRTARRLVLGVAASVAVSALLSHPHPARADGACS